MNFKTFSKRHRVSTHLMICVCCIGLGFSCSSTKSFLGLKSESETLPAISNPFDEKTTIPEHTKVRSRIGDQFTEIDLPQNGGVIDSYTFPNQKYDGSPMTSEEADTKQLPTQSDYEILSKVRRSSNAEDSDRREIERELGVRTLEGEAPTQRRSVLVQIDGVKQLYRNQRYESALVKVDSLIVDVPTLPVLYEMRGTLLERLGHPDLALQSWKQALKLQPTNNRLKKLIDRREKQRGIASGGEK